MADRNGDTPRCAVLVGPYLSGKTSLFESLLFATGAIERKGSTRSGNIVGDAADEARKRQASTELSIGGGRYLEDDWIFIDTPGGVDFAQDMRNAAMVADIAVVVVEPEVAKIPAVVPVLKYLDDHAIPHLIFINKMDGASDDIDALMAALRDASDTPLILRHLPIIEGEQTGGYVDLVSNRAYRFRQDDNSEQIEIPAEMADQHEVTRGEMLETLADFDDELLEQLLEEMVPETGSVYDLLGRTLRDNELVPVLIGSAEGDHGIRRLLKLLRHEGPDCADTAARRGLEAEGTAIAQVFRVMHAQHMGKLCYTRVFRGAVRDGETLNGVRVSGVNSVLGNKLTKRPGAATGEVVSLGRMDEIQIGDVLSPDGAPDDGALAWPAPLSPVYSLAIGADNRNDEVKLSGMLQRLVEEDPSISIEQNADLGELILWGQGETHLRVLMERLENRFKLSVSGRPPSVPYRETIRGSVDQHARHKKQSGGHGQFGDVKVKIAPQPRGAGFLFTDSIVGGVVPKQYIPSVEEGVKDFMRRGPLGFHVVDIGVQLYDGSYHSVDSSDMAFRTAARMAMSEGMRKCDPVLLEPMLHVRISVPNDATARMQRLVTGRRGQILGFSAKDDWKNWDEVEAYLPQSETHDLINEIRSVTLSAGTYEWRFDHLAELTGRQADQVVERRAAELAG